MSKPFPDSPHEPHQRAILASAIASSVGAIALNVLNQKYGTLVPDWLILLLVYAAIGFWLYAMWHIKKVRHVRLLLYTSHPRMFLIVLFVGGAIVGAAAGAGLWVANRNEQRIKAAQSDQPHHAESAQAPQPERPQAPIMAKPNLKARPIIPYPGFLKLNANILEPVSVVGPDVLMPVVIAFENVPDGGGFDETQTVSAFMSYHTPGPSRFEFSRVNQGCWINQPVADVTFPFRTPRYLVLGGWYTKPVNDEFRIFEYSRDLHRPVLQDVKITFPFEILVRIILTPTGHVEVSQEYKFIIVINKHGQNISWTVRGVIE
jgi:hypothetical protein